MVSGFLNRNFAGQKVECHIQKMERKKICQPRILIPGKAVFTNEGETKIFPNKN